MSASTLPVRQKNPPATGAARNRRTEIGVIDTLMNALASLKLTVALLVMGIFIVLVGTLAQVEHDIWEVVPTYFRSWVMWVDVNLFFPPSFFPNWKRVDFPLIPFPGGMTVGLGMLLNLTAAHLWRFSINTRGKRLWSGLAMIAAGVVVTTLVVLAGHSSEGFQVKPPLSWPVLWSLIQLGLVFSWVASGIALWHWGIAPLLRTPQMHATHVVTVILSGLAFTGFTVANYYFLIVGVYPGDDALRILWQLMQGTLAGLVLLVGCYMVFDRRAGVVLLHAGIALMMLNELFVARYAAEYQVTLQEGQTTNYMRDIRTTELALIDRSGQETDEHIVIANSLLVRNAAQNQRLLAAGHAPVAIPDPDNALPVKVAVVRFFKNHDVKRREASDDNPATAGRGLRESIIEIPASTGTDTESKVDFGAAYVKLIEKGTDKDLGTYLVSQYASEQDNPFRAAEKVTAGGKEYNVFLRFKRAYLPYTISLTDVRKDDYLASDTPRNYSSDVILRDSDRAVDEHVHIKMNDPLRYAGLTFYQSGYNRFREGGKLVEMTTLAVVQNTGWMIPYVACAIVSVAMLAHFLLVLSRFLSRRTREEKAVSWRFDRATAIWCGITALVVLGYLTPKLMMPRYDESKFNLAGFGQLPVAHKGRVKPIDTLARNTLRELGQREEVMVDGKKKISATQWFLEVICDSDTVADYPVVRVDNEEVLRVFGLERRKGFRYSMAELQPGFSEFFKQLQATSNLSKEQLTLKQVKLRELYQRLDSYLTLRLAFSPPTLPRMPSPEELAKDPSLREKWLLSVTMAMNESSERLREQQPPLTIPLKNSDGTVTWQSVHDAWINSLRKPSQEKSLAMFQAMQTAYAENNVKEFNSALVRFQDSLASASPQDYHPGKHHTEAWFNHVSPFYLGNILYVLAFILAIVGWLFESRRVNWCSFTLIVLTFVLHTAALVLRIWLSGRPPVTNLYSSAIFIGWAAVLFGIALELYYRKGLGNALAAVSGFATLLVAYFLGSGGDTIEVLQAVLDTQFWLATHVVCISLGYAATYVAGLLGVMYVLLAMGTPLLREGTRKDIARMIYGITCFAIFFSFVGTVLGGLWADDSWGRFWGWDPKENGALIIVLWNAVVLHSRWDKLVGDRGLALLAIGGNIVTSWSWFGVNQLGVGLHSYGFTSGVVMALGWFAFSQLVLIGLGLLPKSLWWSYRADALSRG